MITTQTPPAIEPVTVAEIKRQSYIESDDFDDDVERFIKTARAKVETYLRKRLITQTVRLTTDGFRCGPLNLPIAPIQSVSQVQYLSAAGEWTTLASDQYRLVTSCEPALLTPEFGKSWPVPRMVLANVRIDLVVGYGDAASDVDADILGAIRLLAAHLFENREATIVGQNIADVPFGFESLLGPHRLWV